MPAHDPIVAVRLLPSVFLVIIATTLLGGCPASTDPSPGAESLRWDAVQAEFKAYVDAANHCDHANECVGITPGCPLPCMVAIRTDRRTDVEAKARELRGRLGSTCEATCPSPGPATCVQNRCEIKLPGTSDLPDSSATNEAGGGPFPAVQLNVHPSDGSTGVGTQPLTVSVSAPGPFVPDVKLADLAAAASLVTWPEKQIVDARIEPDPASSRVVLTPASPLQNRWYAIRLRPKDGFFRFNAVPGEPEIAARFRPDSQPQVVRIDFCAKAPPGMKLVLSFSEVLVTTANSGDRVTVEIDGKPAICDLYDRRETALYFTCADLTTASMVKVTVAAGLETPTGGKLVPGSWTVDLSQLADSSCRSFQPPL